MKTLYWVWRGCGVPEMFYDKEEAKARWAELVKSYSDTLEEFGYEAAEARKIAMQKITFEETRVEGEPNGC